MIRIHSVTSAVPTTSATTHSIGAPGGLIKGDIAVLLFTQNTTASISSAPNGGGGAFTLIDGAIPSTTLRMWVYYRLLTGAVDNFVTPSWTFSATQRCVKSLMILRGCVGPGYNAYAVTNSGSVNGVGITFPAVTPTVNDALLIRFAGIRYATASGGVDHPGGWTEQLDVGDATAGVHWGMGIASKQLTGGSGVSEASTAAGVQSSINGALTVAFAPNTTPQAVNGWGMPAIPS